MKKLGKILLIALISIVVLIGAAFVAVSILLPPEKVKNIVISELSKQLDTDITLDKAGVNLFTGIELNKLTIKDPKSFKSTFPSEPLLSVEKIRVDVNIISLIMGNISINGITLDKPAIKMEKNAEGKTNIEMLGGAKSAKTGAAQPADKTTPGENRIIDNFAINKIEVKSAYFHNIDNKLGNENKIHDIDAKIIGFGNKKDTQVSAKLMVNELPVSADTHIMLNLDEKKLDISKLIIGVPRSTITGSGNVDFADKPVINISLSTDKFDLDGLSGASKASSGEKKKEKLKVDVPPDITANIDFSAKQVVSKDNNIDNLKTAVKLANQMLSINVDATVKGSPFSAKVSGDFRDRFYPKIVADANLSELKITIKEKDPNSPEAKISNADIDKATVNIPENLSIKANIKVTKLDIGNLIAQNNTINLIMDKKIVNLSVANDVYGGKFKMNGVFDANVSGLGYNISSLNATNVDGAGLLRDFSTTFLPKSLRGLVGDLLDSGKANLSVSAKGTGIGSETLMKNLTSSVVFNSDNAVLKENKMLSAVAPLVQNHKLAGKVALDKLNAKISTTNGTAKANVEFSSKDANLKATFTGDIDLVGKVYGNNKLSVWVDNKPVEFKLTGAIDKPIPQPLVLEQKTQELKGQAQQQIDTKKQELQQDVNKKGEEMLKNLFGK